MNKKLLSVLVLLLVAVGYFLSDKVLLLTKTPTLVSSSAQSSVLAFYTRYQLQPDTKQLSYSMKLLALSKELTPVHKDIIQKIIVYLDKMPPYSERAILSEVEKIKLKPLNKANTVSVMGFDLSKFIKVDDTSHKTAAWLIKELRWAILQHDVSAVNVITHQLQELVSNPKSLQVLRDLQLTPPKLPWQTWLMELG